jgi:iron complex outermembrane receptor protein
MMRDIFLLLAAALAAFGQGSVDGRVVDPSESPIPNARVSIIERDSQVRRSAIANGAGEFRFPSLRPGEYLIAAQADGFGASPPRLVRLTSGEIAKLELSLEIARLSTQVQVTAASIAQTVDEQSKALDVIDSGQIARRAEFTVADALRTAPGVRVMQFGGPGSFTRILVRGTRPTDTSVLVDGIRLRDAAAPQGDATGFVSDLLLANTDRIEVLRGSGSSLYGTHATGGILNMITDQGGRDFHGDLTAEGGGLGSFRSAARFSGATLRDRLRFSGGATHLNVSDGVDGDDRARNVTGHGFVQFQVRPMTIVTGRVLVADTFAALNDNAYPMPAVQLPPGEIVQAIPGVTYTPAPNDPDQRRWATMISNVIGVSHSWTPGVTTRVNYALVDTHRNNRDGVLGQRFEPMFPTQDLFDGRIDTLQARGDFQANRNHLFTAGYEFEREAYDNLSRDQNPDPATRVNARLRIGQTSHAAFGQVQGRYLDDRLQVLLSGRVQRFSLGRPTFSDNSPLYTGMPISTPPDARTGDISASYMIARNSTKIRAHVGNGYRAPALYERFGAAFFGGFFAPYGDPRLGPERVLAFDGGFDQYLASSRVRVSMTYFYTRIQEAIIFDFSGLILPDTDPYSRWGGYRNTGGGLARGIEVSMEANPLRSLTLQSSYTYTNSDDRTSQYGNSVLRAVRVSDHMFTATASQRLWRSIDLTMDLFAASDFLAPFGNRAFRWDGPVKADIVASYTRTLTDRHMLRFYTRVENVLNRRYYEEGFLTPRAWAMAGIRWMF